MTLWTNYAGFTWQLDGTKPIRGTHPFLPKPTNQKDTCGWTKSCTTLEPRNDSISLYIPTSVMVSAMASFRATRASSIHIGPKATGRVLPPRPRASASPAPAAPLWLDPGWRWAGPCPGWPRRARERAAGCVRCNRSERNPRGVVVKTDRCSKRRRRGDHLWPG